jgi:hypothetical protein
MPVIVLRSVLAFTAHTSISGSSSITGVKHTCTPAIPAVSSALERRFGGGGSGEPLHALFLRAVSDARAEHVYWGQLNEHLADLGPALGVAERLRGGA